LFIPWECFAKGDGLELEKGVVAGVNRGSFVESSVGLEMFALGTEDQTLEHMRLDVIVAVLDGFVCLLDTL